MTRLEAIAQAKAKGATDAEIEAETERQRRQVGTVPFRNMILALTICAWNNSKDEWVRLAAALTAKATKQHASA